MKIKAGKRRKVDLDSLDGGTPFWYQNYLYMKLEKPGEGQEKTRYNVVELTSGRLMKWEIENPDVADVEIVDCD